MWQLVVCMQHMYTVTTHMSNQSSAESPVYFPCAFTNLPHVQSPACTAASPAIYLFPVTHRTLGEKILRRMGLSLMFLLPPDTRSVSLDISARMRSKS